ncbi:DUF6059 family protein [Phytohabitans suffuscus]|uniref:Uncharacterized protein n=1 Tax=Phytohabitans suffuscus TaxID=624315 RepID=A0A6F8Y9Q0_9ACTN|nr:DUF6059 family protein [Phytohabitans suffuscus]BCB82708.1 hypothetical protein Psuf_000210 [Phytohabitans suffuscus]
MDGHSLRAAFKEIRRHMAIACLMASPFVPYETMMLMLSAPTEPAPQEGHPERVTGRPPSRVERRLWAQLDTRRRPRWSRRRSAS